MSEMMKAASRIVVFLSLVVLNVNAQGSLFCPLCGDYTKSPTSYTMVVNGKTCQDHVMQASKFDAGTGSCTTYQAQNNACCVDLPPAASPPVASPTVQQGNEPECPVCRTQEFPGKPDEFVNARYVGSYNCKQLYYRGLNGLIPGQMCLALQDFTVKVCGCGVHHPDCQQDSSKCYGNNGNPPPPAPAPVPPPASPTIESGRKTRPSTGKYAKKLSTGRGGSARRGGRLLEENSSPIDMEELPEINLLEANELEQSTRSNGAVRTRNLSGLRGGSLTEKSSPTELVYSS